VALFLLACLGRADSARKRCAQLLRIKTKRSRGTLIGDAAIRVDQIQAVGPARVSPFRSIAKLIKNTGKFNAELSYTSSGYECAFVLVLRAGEDDLIFYVALHLPDVAGVGFSDVDDQESHLILVFLIEFVEGRNLLPKGRSSVTAENQHNGLLFIQSGKLNPFCLVDF
jgi:hypothetical protein